VLDPSSSTIDSIYFIEEGEVQVTTEFESNEFILDTLGPGSAINHRAIFLKDQMYVNLQAMTEVKILFLKLTTLNELVDKHDQEVSSGANDPKTIE